MQVRIEAGESSGGGTFVRVVVLVPTSGFFLCLGTPTASGASGPLLRRRRVRPSDLTATWRGHTGSISRLFNVQSLSHSCNSRALESQPKVR